MAPPQATEGVAVEVDKLIEGKETGSRNYRFSKIGESIPINSGFNPPSLPSQPLAVSERLRLLFVAFPNGFHVARTKDVVTTAEASKEKQKGQSLQDLSLVDVPIGKVSILALSADDSLLAVSVDSYVHFFAVSALLNKEHKPSYSATLDDSSCIKDFRWAKIVAKAYLVLSANGNLYHGTGQGPLGYVMDCIDSVDWSVEDNFVAVAKKNTISILSSQFKEKLRFSLPFRSVGESDVNQVIKVDSIRWIRPDCLAVGCFQLNADGNEENYLVQLITSRDGMLTDEASKPTVLSFNNIFMDFCSDAVLARNGPHLLLSYLDFYGLAFVANRNLSSTVGLFCWLPNGEKNEPSVIEILNDAWTLYIDSQDNGEENMILGLSVDKVSQNENVRFTLGDEETEVAPCCVIICLTIDGKISVFHFASAAVPLTSPESCASDENDDASQIFVKGELPMISSTGGEESKDLALSSTGSHNFSKFEIEKTSAEVTNTDDLLPSCNVDIKFQEQTGNENLGQKNVGQKPLVYLRSPKLAEPIKAFPVILNQDSKMENESISELKHSASLSSGSNYSKSADGRFSLFPSDVENSNKPSSDSSVNVLCHPTVINEISKPTASFPSLGQTGSTVQCHKIPLSANPGSQVSPGESAAPGKLFQFEFRKEVNSPLSRPGLQYSVQNASKQSGNVEELASKLDTLLDGIEGKGGFLDASITSHTNSVMELEDNIWMLSSNCRMWRGLMTEQLQELQPLLDKTVQASVRKVYMEGVFKQATDSRYWELWNRQKLSSELELKQRRISELHQELTNKLIELERHFNSLELNKFGNDEMQRNRRVVQNWHAQSRQTQSLNSLHNTMQAQLAAAEQLSGCLSNQMVALSIESSENHDFKKKLFESIGLSYIDDSERSPAMDKISNIPLTKGQLITSSSVTSKDHTGRNQSTFAKTPETARRRRDSLDRSWASFEPPKTIMKRVLEEYDQGNTRLPLLNIDKQNLSPQPQKKSEVVHLANSNMYRATLNSYKSKGVAEVREQHMGDPLKIVHQSLTNLNSSAPIPPMLETKRGQSSGQVAFEPIDEKSRSNLASTGNKDNFVAASEFSFGRKHSDTSLQPLPSVLAQLPKQSLASASVSTEASDHFKVGFTRPSAEEQNKNGNSVSSFVSKTLTPVAKQKSVLQPQTSVPSTLNLQSNLSSISPSPSITKTNTQTSLFQPLDPVLVSKTESLPLTNTSVYNVLAGTENDVKIQASLPKSQLSFSASGSTLGLSASSGLTEWPRDSKVGRQIDALGLSTSSAVTSLTGAELPTAAEVRSPASSSREGFIPSAKTVVLSSSDEEEMEEEAPETAELSLGNFSGFGIGSMPNLPPPVLNPFGVSTLNTNITPFASSPNTSGELFRPASFQFQPAVDFSGGFRPENSGQVSAFGAPANIGSGQQAMGSVLGSFGQSRQLGHSLPGSNLPPASGFNGISPAGFGGGFASASTDGGFAAAAAAGGGFTAAAAAGAASNPGGAFSSFGNQHGGSGFAAFGGGPGAGSPPSNLFTQMRK